MNPIAVKSTQQALGKMCYKASRALKIAMLNILSVASFGTAAGAQVINYNHDGIDYKFQAIIQYADLLMSTQNGMSLKIQTWDANSKGQEALDHLKANDTIPYEHFPWSKASEATEWGIRARLCDEFLIIYYKDNNFKFGIKPEDIRIAQKLRFKEIGEYERAMNEPPFGYINDTSLITDSGETIPIPACLDANYATPLPRNTVARMGRVRAHGLYSHTKEYGEYRTEVCPDGKVGTGIRQKRIKYVPVTASAKKLTDLITYGPWETLLDSCRTPIDRISVGPPLECWWTITGTVAKKSRATYKYRWKEFPDPRNPFNVISLYVDYHTGELVENPSSELMHSFCDVQPVADEVTTSQVLTPETRTKACTAVYPTPSYYSKIDYTRGTYVEERNKVDLTQTYDWDRDPIHITSYTDWKVKEDTCHRYLYEYSDHNEESKACEIPSDLGARIYDQEVQHFKRDDASIGYELLYKDSAKAHLTKPILLKSNDCYYLQNMGSVATADRVPGCTNGRSSSIFKTTKRKIWRDGRAQSEGDLVIGYMYGSGVSCDTTHSYAEDEGHGENEGYGLISQRDGGRDGAGSGGGGGENSGGEGGGSNF